MLFRSHQRKSSQLSRLQKMGVTLCADDFSSGQSSPLLLRQGLWSAIKLERGFIAKLLTHDYIRVFVKTRIQVAKAAGISVCATGVETREELDLLLGFGIDSLQGHFIAPPMTLEELRTYLAPENHTHQ